MVGEKGVTKKEEKCGVVLAPKKHYSNPGQKLEKTIKSGGQIKTPVFPPWRLLQQLLPPAAHVSSSSSQCGGAHDSVVRLYHLVGGNGQPLQSCASARKLGATVWEVYYQCCNFAPAAKMRRQHHLVVHHDDPVSPQLGTASSLRRHVAASLLQHHRGIQRDHQAIQPVSPASYGSSMEVTPYNPAVTPSSSVANGETSYTLKTSTELLKVLNRIWSLEEQHAANISLVRALKKELDQARSKIKVLVRDQQADRHEIDELTKQLAEDNNSRKTKEHDRVSSAIQSVRDELDDERKLRKRSETLHRKLARELYDVKTSLASAIKDLEKERKSRKLLEQLCDEFSWGIKNYEQEMHSLKKDRTNRADRDGLILHISESWLDERMQIKQEPQLGEKVSAAEKLSSEIEAFLQAKRSGVSNGRDSSVPRRRNSLESIPVNLAGSAPRGEGEEEVSSAESDSHCFELGNPVAIDFKSQGDESQGKSIQSKKKFASEERANARNPSNMQVTFEEQMAEAILGKEEAKSGEEFAAERNLSQKYEIFEAAEENNTERKYKVNGSTSNHMDNLMRSHYLISEAGGMQQENDVWKSRGSPIRQWTTRLPTPAQDHLDIAAVSCSKQPQDSKENTLKAKLLEARTRGQRSRSRLKSSKLLC